MRRRAAAPHRWRRTPGFRCRPAWPIGWESLTRLWLSCPPPLSFVSPLCAPGSWKPATVAGFSSTTGFLAARAMPSPAISTAPDASRAAARPQPLLPPALPPWPERPWPRPLPAAGGAERGGCGAWRAEWAYGACGRVRGSPLPLRLPPKLPGPPAPARAARAERGLGVHSSFGSRAVAARTTASLGGPLPS
jgi:hypothetical protein